MHANENMRWRARSFTVSAKRMAPMAERALATPAGSSASNPHPRTTARRARSIERSASAAGTLTTTVARPLFSESTFTPTGPPARS